MEKNKILLLKKEAKLKNGLEFPAGTEFHTVMGVVYMKGFPLPQGVQPTVIKWIEDNPKLFKEIFR
jgi:hypothetical protein